MSGHYSGGMPRTPVSPDPLPALEAALDAARGSAREGADEVLSHYPELGDRDTQSTLEAHLDQVADLLREVEASCAELCDRVRLSRRGGSARARGGVAQDSHRSETSVPEAFGPVDGRRA